MPTPDIDKMLSMERDRLSDLKHGRLDSGHVDAHDSRLADVEAEIEARRVTST